MSIQPELIKQSELLGRLVLDRETMEEVGKVERLWLNPHTHKIVGFTAKSGLLGLKKVSVAWQQIYSLGTNILVNNIAERDEWKKPDTSEQILGWELLTENGNEAGKIEDYLIEPITGEVISYLFLASDRGNILTRRFLLSPEGITNIGNKRVLARTVAVENSQPYTEGLNRLLVQAKDFIIEDRENTLQHLEAVKSRFTNLVEQFKTDAPPKIEQVKGQVSDKVQELKEQATEKAQEFKEQATGKAQELKAQAQEKAQSLAEGAQPMINQAKERVQGIAEGAKEKVQSIADEAKKQLDKNPELVAPSDEKVTQTIETTAERVTTNLPPVTDTLGEGGAIDQPSVAIETTKTTEHQGS
jgi:uncharacterized protein YrrD